MTTQLQYAAHSLRRSIEELIAEAGRTGDNSLASQLMVVAQPLTAAVAHIPVPEHLKPPEKPVNLREEMARLSRVAARYRRFPWPVPLVISQPLDVLELTDDVIDTSPAAELSVMPPDRRLLGHISPAAAMGWGDPPRRPQDAMGSFGPGTTT